MILSRPWGLCVCLGLSSLAAACGGDSDNDGKDDPSDERCPFASCGGDVVGTWEIDSACVTIDELPMLSDDPECQDFVRDYSVDVEGTITFTADGMTQTNITNTVNIEADITAACWEAFSGTELNSVACALIEANLVAEGEFSSAVCTFDSGTCSCSLVRQPMTTNETGTYTIDGDELIDQDGEAAGYCVEGDQLTMDLPIDEGTVILSAARSS